MEDEPVVSFDEFSKIRILSSQSFEVSDHLKDECTDFSKKISEFNGIVSQFLSAMQERMQQIETEKLKAIGLRNKVDGEVERRKAITTQYRLMIKERQAELERLQVQEESLRMVLAEQQRLIESLSSK